VIDKLENASDDECGISRLEGKGIGSEAEEFAGEVGEKLG
jgi:hypothetical protein